MKSFKTDNHTFLFYDNIKELPISQYKEFIKASLVDSGIGSTLEDIKSHVVRIFDFINNDKKDLAQNELNNLFINANYILEKFSTASFALVYLLKSIDGEKVRFDELDDDSLVELHNKFSEISHLSLIELLDKVKKNYSLN